MKNTNLLITKIVALLILLAMLLPGPTYAEEPALDFDSMQPVNYYRFGVQLGKCDASRAIQMCNDKRAVWHIYADMAVPLTRKGSLLLTGSAEHFSAFEDEDLHGEYGSGQFNYMGFGLELNL